MLKFISIFVVLFSLVNGGAIQVNQCQKADADAPLPVNVIIPRCEAPPCILKKGESYKVEVDFDVPRNTENLTVVVSGIIAGIELPWNGVDEDGCQDMLIGRCPLHAGDYWTYGVELTVLPVYPETKLIIKWKMLDDENKAVWCFLLPAEIQT